MYQKGVLRVNLYKFCWWLLVIGGLNWGLVGLLNVNAVAYLGDTLTRIVYILVGAAAVYMLSKMKK
jgi:uncharacterized membrane protein YuzA (DUF378 family)